MRPGFNPGERQVQALSWFNLAQGRWPTCIRGPRGPGATKLKNAVPGELCDEWLQVTLDRRKAVPHQKTIIDLGAGPQSIKPWAL